MKTKSKPYSTKIKKGSEIPTDEIVKGTISDLINAEEYHSLWF